jgi:cytochrome c556
MKTLLTIVTTWSLILLLACSGQKDTANADLNPNGDSELAVLMREMFDDGMAMKKAIEKGKLPQSHIEISELFTAEGTEPEKVASEQYKAYAKVYEAAFVALQNAEDEAEIQTAYTSLVNTCVSCHQAMCPGPITRIRKMELSNAD